MATLMLDSAEAETKIGGAYRHKPCEVCCKKSHSNNWIPIHDDVNSVTKEPRDDDSIYTNERCWTCWIASHTTAHSKVPSDYGLTSIAQFLGPQHVLAHQHALRGAVLEADRNIADAMRAYATAYRLWPSLDSVHEGGLPRDVRIDAIEAGYLDDDNVSRGGGGTAVAALLDVVSVSKAQASRVVGVRNLLSVQDASHVRAVQQLVYETDAGNNPENQRHTHKSACMLNNPPHFPLQTLCPSIVGRLIEFAQRSWVAGEWSGPDGPLEQLQDGIQCLSVRVIEFWEYTVGGGLTDPYHYDTDSIVTIVALLSHANDCDGGAFRTWEKSGEHTVHHLDFGDAVAFVSHKYHNITELTNGFRQSLVVELWQGGVGHEGR